MGIILQVGILDNDDVGQRLPETGAQGRSFALVGLVVKKPDTLIVRGHFFENITSPIRRAIINNNNLAYN